jgi:alkanesulfonate monooxygenase SsuD/methylene tetrahydromethanopterin reductase-like flavin-dependent oxidoreductase (luciferase family)
VPALEFYRANFRPSAQLEAPRVMLAANVLVADDDETAQRLFTSTQRSFVDGIFRRKRPLLGPPIGSIAEYTQPHEQAQLDSMLSVSFVGAPETVRAGLEAFIAEHAPDELIVATSAFDQEVRLRSLELLASLQVGAAVA